MNNNNNNNNNNAVVRNKYSREFIDHGVEPSLNSGYLPDATGKVAVFAFDAMQHRTAGCVDICAQLTVKQCDYIGTSAHPARHYVCRVCIHGRKTKIYLLTGYTMLNRKACRAT